MLRNIPVNWTASFLSEGVFCRGSSGFLLAFPFVWKCFDKHKTICMPAFYLFIEDDKIKGDGFIFEKVNLGPVLVPWLWLYYIGYTNVLFAKNLFNCTYPTYISNSVRILGCMNVNVCAVLDFDDSTLQVNHFDEVGWRQSFLKKSNEQKSFCLNFTCFTCVLGNKSLLFMIADNPVLFSRCIP